MLRRVIEEPFRWTRYALLRTFDYSGRSRRMEFWSYALIAFAVMSIVVWAEQAAGIGDQKEGPIRPVLGFILFIPGLAVGVRRLHDSNLAGWWAALPFAPPLVAAMLHMAQLNSDGLFRAFLIAMMVAPIATLVLMGLPGTRGPNRFGEDPKDESDFWTSAAADPEQESRTET